MRNKKDWNLWCNATSENECLSSLIARLVDFQRSLKNEQT